MQSTTIPLLDATIIDIYPSPSQQQQPSSQDTTMKQRGWKPFDSITNLTVSIPQPLSKPRLPSSTNQTDSAREGQRLRTRSNTGPSPARWRTKEFYAYYAIGVAAVFYMAKVTVDLSRESHPNYVHFSHRLSEGWMFGWKVDTSDHQWSTFRNNIPILCGLVLLWLLASFLFFGRSLSPSPSPESSTSVATKLPPPSSSRTTFILLFTIPLLTIYHGTSLLKMFILLSLNFAVSRLASYNNGKFAKAVPALTWILNIGLLFSNEIYDGYRWSSLSHHLSWMDEKSFGGMLPRWQISWNISMLRLVSYNLDYYWACTSVPPSPIDEKTSSLVLDERSRTVTSHPLSSYTFKNYITYVLYPPLYIAGPILTFNSFFSQLVIPSAISRKTIIGYMIRFVVCLLTIELVLHSMYIVAIKDSSKEGAWLGDTPFELSMIGFWNLIVVWLKLLIPWRFFRLWALLDGIDPPENMVRCMANNYSTLGFWRAWHRSYNLWVVRYLYIPLGGAKHAILATLTVFTFVALWHDLSLKLLTWGWVISLFVVPEMTAQKVVPSEKYGSTWWYRHVAAIGGVGNVLLMMTANLIGFAIGTDGMAYMWKQMIGTWAGLKFMVIASGCLFAAVQLMFEYREEETRKGISRRC